MRKLIDTLLIAVIFCLAVIMASCTSGRCGKLTTRYDVVIPKVVIHVLPANDPFWAQNHCDGKASSTGEIWVKGKWVDGKILIEDHVYNHELLHLINFKNNLFWNPDKYRGW